MGHLLSPNVCVACSNQKLPIMSLNCDKAMEVGAHNDKLLVHNSLLVTYFIFYVFKPCPATPLEMGIRSMLDDVRARTRLTFSSCVGDSVQVW